MLSKEKRPQFDIAKLADVQQDYTAPHRVHVGLTLDNGRKVRIPGVEKPLTFRNLGDIYVGFSINGAAYLAFWEQSKFEALKESSNNMAIELASRGRDRWWLFHDHVYRDDSSLNAEQVTALLQLRDETAQRKANRALAIVERRKRTATQPTTLDPPSAASGNSPRPQFIKSWEDAERVAQEWMRYFGYADALLTGEGADSGIDIQASAAVAQVKAEMRGKTGRPVVQQLYGVAHAAQKMGIIFSLSGYTEGAIEWANGVGVALFEFNKDGQPQPVNQAAKGVVTQGERGAVSESSSSEVPPCLQSLPGGSSILRGEVNGTAAFYGTVIGVAKRDDAYAIIIVRTSGSFPNVMGPYSDVDWFTQRSLSWWPNLISPYSRDEKIANGCSITLPSAQLQELINTPGWNTVENWIRSARGWFYRAPRSGRLAFSRGSPSPVRR